MIDPQLGQPDDAPETPATVESLMPADAPGGDKTSAPSGEHCGPDQTTFATEANFAQPVLQWDDEAGLWRLIFTYVFTWRDPKTGRLERIRIPAGYLYDKASVPRLLQGIARADGPWEGPSFLHDEAYRFLQKGGGGFPPGMYEIQLPDGTWVDGPPRDRLWADWLLRFAAKCTKKISWGERWKYWTAVRVYPPNWLKGF